MPSKKMGGARGIEFPRVSDSENVVVFCIGDVKFLGENSHGFAGKLRLNSLSALVDIYLK